jgi:sterol desaturase/sphingolipid hydroxylase (fatty acid hydroxylase superfamily)
MPTHASPYYLEWRILLGALFAALVFETTVLVWRRGRGYAPLDLVSTFTSWGVMELSRFASFGLRFGVFVAVAAYRPFALASNALTFVLTYIAVDAIYYARHRLLHTTRWGWALHEAHHSSTDLTLLSALRLGWVQRLVDDFFYLPILFFGVDPLLVLVVIEVNHGYQLWCHTTCIGRLPRLDRFWNTPSNHRVHHADERALCDANYGSTFMIWDRLFGTYRPEPEGGVTRFGLEGVDRGLSPLAYQLDPLFEWLASWRPRRTSASAPSAIPIGRSSGDDA